MKVRDVMTREVVTVGPDAAFPAVVDVLLTHDISGVPVVDGAGTLLGIVTEADLVTKEAYGRRRRRALGLLADYLRGHDPQWVRKSAGRTAGEVMTTAVSVAAPDDELASAARRMLEANHKRLPVVEGGRLVGIVTRHDLLRPLHRPDEAILTDIQRLLGEPMRVPERHEAQASVSGGVVTLNGTARVPSDIGVLEQVVGAVPGVVAVENRLTAREPEPRATAR